MLSMFCDKSRFADITCELTAAVDGRSGRRLPEGLDPPCPDIRFTVAPDSCGPWLLAGTVFDNSVSESAAESPGGRGLYGR